MQMEAHERMDACLFDLGNVLMGFDHRIFCRRLAAHSAIPLDIHLMVENVDAFIPLFAAAAAAPAGARRRLPPALYIHPETSYHPLRTLALIRECGARPGIALDPALPVAAVRALLPHVELACVMGVNPGFAGQKLVPGTLEKIAELAGEIRRGGHPVRIEVDGALGSGPTGTSVRECRPVINADFDTNPATLPWRQLAEWHH